MKINSKILQKGLVGFVGLVVLANFSGCAQRTTCESCKADKFFGKQNAKEIEVAKLQTKLAKCTTINKVYQSVPPNAEPGECYTRVMIPAQYKKVKVKVLVKEPSTKIITVPAKFKDVTTKVLVKEASTKVVTLPPVYKLVKEKVLVKQPETKLIPIPAVYKTIKEKVLVKPAHTEWKLGKGLYDNVLKTKKTSTGEIMCLVKVPAQYKIVTKKVIVKPAGVKKVTVPAVYKNITKKVLERPAVEKVIKIPAVYKTVHKRVMVSPAEEKVVPVPAVYKYVDRTIKVKDSELKWMRVICKTNFTPNRVMMVQRALKRAGFYNGEIDGIFGPSSQEALRKFQKSRGLATAGVTIESLKALGVYK